MESGTKKSDVEFLEEAQELFEEMDFGSNIVVGMDNWQLQKSSGDYSMEASLVIYIVDEDNPEEDSEKAFVNIRFDNYDKNPIEAYAVNSYGDDIAIVDTREFTVRKQSEILERELKERINQSKNNAKPKI